MIRHSLGGFMAFYLASTEPKAFGPLIAVDGVPWLVALGNPNVSVDDVRKMAGPGVEAMKKTTQEAFRAQTIAAMKIQMLDQKRAEEFAKPAGESDPAAVGQAMFEMMTTDLRADVAKIESPILLIAAGEWAKTDAQKDSIRKMYEPQIAKAKNGHLEVATKARHFVMFDDFPFFIDQVETFLAKP